MTLDSLSVIRRGWQDGASSVAPRVPGLADLLDRRLEEAIRKGTMDETTLLAIVDSATQLAADCGSAEVVPALSKRLRRRVYEYLLSLDAAPAAERPAPSPPSEPAPEWGGMWPGFEDETHRPPSAHAPAAGPLLGAEEAAALAQPQLPEFSPIPLVPRFDARRREPPGPAPAPPATPASERQDRAPSATPDLPHFRFHIGDPDDLPADAPRDEPGRTNGNGQTPPQALTPARPALTDASAPRHASFADPTTWARPVTPGPRPGRSDQAEASPPDTTPPPSEGRLSISWPSAPDPRREIPGPRGGRPSGHAAETGQPARDGGPAAREPAGERSRPPVPRDGDQSLEGWAVRRPDTVTLNLRPLSGGPFEADDQAMEPMTVDEIPESDLRQLRTAIELKLRKKKCDDAAAMLQRAANELGGRAVAEMALDIGDRCRALGKRNAALNCYLAASRADPIFEPPLARLADICVDDHDIDLAVSYLERIARLTRLRGDSRGALHVYRKIATIAPYRDDVLDMLMRAQTTGRLEP